MAFKPNPDLYEELSTPRASTNEAESSLDAFLKEVAELRKKYRIPEMVCVAGSYGMSGEGKKLVNSFLTGGNALVYWELINKLRSQLAIDVVESSVKAKMRWIEEI